MTKTIKELELELQKSKRDLAIYIKNLSKKQDDLNKKKNAEAEKKAKADKAKALEAKKAAEIDQFLVQFGKNSVDVIKATPAPIAPETPKKVDEVKNDPPAKKEEKLPETPKKKTFLDGLMGK